MSAQPCAAEVWRGGEWNRYREACGKPAKGTLDGFPACGVHLGAARRRQEKKADLAQWQARVDAINVVLAIDAHGWEVGQSLGVRIDRLERLAAEVERLRIEAGR